jgi:hypothetical protein
MVTLDQVLPFQWANTDVTVLFGALVSATAHASFLAGAMMASNSLLAPPWVLYAICHSSCDAVLAEVAAWAGAVAASAASPVAAIPIAVLSVALPRSHACVRTDFSFFPASRIVNLVLAVSR